MLPSLYLSHGSPMLALRPSPAHAFLSALGGQLERPKGIVVASAHWDTEHPTVSRMTVNDTIHDFYGFPPPLYALRYPAPGDAALADRVIGLLRAAGLPAEADETRGLDHGAWVPLLLMYPQHDIPVLQLSLQSWQGSHHQYLLGQALAPLRQEGVLVIGSGAFTHNLRRMRRDDLDGSPEPDVAAFADWMHDAITAHRLDDLLDYRRKAPYAAQQHPTDEHLQPLFVALGAAGENAPARRLHTSTEYGVLRMDSFAFGSA